MAKRKSTPQKKRIVLTKTDLLPISREHARALSLKCYAGLVEIQKGSGERGHVAELLKTLYLTYLLVDAELTGEGRNALLAAEMALQALLDVEEGQPMQPLNEADHEAISAVIVEHDWQLSRRRAYDVHLARDVLYEIYSRGSTPNIADRARA